MKDPQDVMSALLAEKVASGAELGLQVAAYLDGELIVDAVAGVADAESKVPVTPDTLFTIFSCSKGVTATVVHLLVERGVFGYDDPVAEYWPEFGRFGKEGITLRHVLAHTAGLARIPFGVDFADWDAMCWAITNMDPEWEPGTAVGYSAMTFGYILGEVIRRADGRPVGQIVADDVLAPIGLSDLYFGVPYAQLRRVATLENDSALIDGPLAYYGTRFYGPRFNDEALRTACMPAGGVIGTARALAGMYAGLIGDGLGGRRIFPAERVRVATELQTDALDRELGYATRKGLGYKLGEPLSPIGETPTAFGHTGHGGSVGFADPEHHLAFALTKNRLMIHAERGIGTAHDVAYALRACLGSASTGGH